MRVGAIGETELRVHPLLLIVLAAACVLGRLNALLQAVLALSLHEAGHAVLSYAFGSRVYALELMPFGAVARIAHRPGDARAALCIAAAGPIVSILIAGMTAMLAYLLPETAGQTDAFLTFNLVLAAVNLLPALPLDGGRILRALLTGRMAERNATRLCAWLGVLFSTGLLALTGLCAYRGVYNLTFPVMGTFLLIAALRELSAQPEPGVRRTLRRFDVIREGDAVPILHMAAHADMKAGEAMRLLRRDRFHVLRVVDGHMRTVGELSESDLLRGIAAHGADASLAALLAFDRSGGL